MQDVLRADGGKVRLAAAIGWCGEGLPSGEFDVKISLELKLPITVSTCALGSTRWPREGVETFVIPSWPRRGVLQKRAVQTYLIVQARPRPYYATSEALLQWQHQNARFDASVS